MTDGRIPQTVIDDARALSVAAVAERYGFRCTSPHETVGPCPGCGGTDRFSVNAKKNIWRCRQGGGDPVGGDAIALVQHVDDCGFREAVERLSGDWSGLVPKADTRVADDTANQFREKERRRAYGIWKAAAPTTAGGIVEAYFRLRGLDPADAVLPGAHCREHGGLAYWHHIETGRILPDGKPEKDWRIVHRGPAMLWPIVHRDGHFLGVHVTWLDLGAARGKAEIVAPDTGELLPAKKVRGSKKGGRIVLCNTPDRTEGAAGEGIETALSWRTMRGFTGRLWSTVDLGNLAGRAVRTVGHPTHRITRSDGRRMPVRVPGPDPRIDDDQARLFAPDPGMRRLILLADGDSDTFATRAAMQRAEARLALVAADPAFGLDRLSVETDWSAPAGHDFNSWLLALKGREPDGDAME